MGIQLNDLATQEATAVVEYGGDTAKVVFKPGVLTAEWLEKADTVREVDELIDLLADLLLRWDVKKGQKSFPPNKKNLREVPVSFLRTVVNTIVENQNDGLGEADGS